MTLALLFLPPLALELSFLLGELCSVILLIAKRT